MKIKIEKNKNLLEYNSYNIRAYARYFVEIKSKNNILEIFNWIRKNNIKKYFILGEGTNTIFLDKEYDGLVIKINNTFVKWNSQDMVEVGAGKNWDRFLGLCQKKNFYNIQSMSDIPGSVGAAVFGNIGAFGSEIKKYVKGVWVFDIKKNDFIFFDNKKMNFSYRNSYIKENRKDFLIYSVIFDFSKVFQKEMNERYDGEEYFSLDHFIKKHNLGQVKNSDIRINIKRIRKAIYPDLKKFPNVGSTFKNTEVTKVVLKNILKKYPDIPHWEMKNKKNKIPTAYIFDKVLDLNGKRFENIEIDKKRPLFLKNMGGATGKEFFKLCQKIKKITKKKLGIDINEEVIFVK